MKDTSSDLHYQYGVLRYTGVKETRDFARASYFNRRQTSTQKFFTENQSQKKKKTLRN